MRWRIADELHLSHRANRSGMRLCGAVRQRCASVHVQTMRRRGLSCEACGAYSASSLLPDDWARDPIRCDECIERGRSPAPVAIRWTKPTRTPAPRTKKPSQATPRRRPLDGRSGRAHPRADRAERELIQNPARSNKFIAALIGVGYMTVGRARHRLERAGRIAPWRGASRWGPRRSGGQRSERADSERETPPER
jgi:hypothetical protein